MIIDCISDLHGHYPTLKGGDLLIVAGDLTARDEEDQYYEFNYWLCQQEYDHKIVIAGNHDNLLQEDYFQYLEGEPAFGYLCDSGTEFKGLKIWGSPWTCKFEGQNPQAMAFTVNTDEELEEKWKLIPDNIDILITHSPPLDFFDKISENRLAGSPSLLIRSMEIRPKIHCFGHIHECGGSKKFIRIYDEKHEQGIWYINASIVDENYKHVNKPVRMVL